MIWVLGVIAVLLVIVGYCVWCVKNLMTRLVYIQAQMFQGGMLSQVQAAEMEEGERRGVGNVVEDVVQDRYPKYEVGRY